MGYKLPDDVDAVDGITWYLVAIPDDPAYRTAALGAYTEIAQVWKWGLEKISDDSYTARQHWLDAIDATIGLIEMGFPTTLLTKIQELIDSQCCPTPTSINIEIPGTGYNVSAGNDIEDGVGAWPTLHGETTTTSWANWSIQKCRAADLIAQAPALLMGNLDLVSDYRNELGYAEMVGQMLGAVPGLGDVFAAAWETWLAIIDPVLDWVVDFETAVTEIEAVEDNIKCAAYTADGAVAAAAAMKAACKAGMTGTAAKLIVDVFPWQEWATSIYTGTMLDVDGNDIYLSDSADWNTSADCTCGYEEDFTFLFDASNGGWSFSTRAGWSDGNNICWSNPQDQYGIATMTITRPNLATAMGISDGAMYPDLMTVDLYENPGLTGYWADGKTVRAIIYYSDATTDETVFSSEQTAGSITVNAAKSLRSTSFCIALEFEDVVGDNQNSEVWIDNFRVALHT